MADLLRIPPTPRVEIDTEGLRTQAEAQHGVASRAQLAELGFSGGAISRWLKAGRLHRIHPHVYAVGHTALPLEGRLWAALLYAGPGAVLSHTTAGWIWSLIEDAPRRIHLTTAGASSSLPDVRIHQSRQVDSAAHRCFPVTSVPRTLLDLGGVLSARQLRRALAEADYRGELDISAVESVLGRGRPGSRALRVALAHHLPALAQTLSELEERFLELCEAAGLPRPEVNAKVGRMRVDAIWRDQRLVVELDGVAAHGGWAAIKRDRAREMALRASGCQVVRYTWEQVTAHRNEVLPDLRRLLAG
jgi:predicted transcriptional regulator of viral defense system